VELEESSTANRRTPEGGGVMTPADRDTPHAAAVADCASDGLHATLSYDYIKTHPLGIYKCMDCGRYCVGSDKQWYPAEVFRDVFAKLAQEDNEKAVAS
jgi:hypothetical protein